MAQERDLSGDLVRKNRQLRDALDELLTAIEESPGYIDTTKAQDKLPDTNAEKDPIQPPWEREGYESKQAWLKDR